MAEPAPSSTGLTPEAASCEEWLRRVGALTIASPSGGDDDEIVSATKTAAALMARARSLVEQGRVPARSCGADPCSVCEQPDLSCDLVRDLAARHPDDTPPRADVEAYRRALAAAGAAVFTCRRTLHASDNCLFGPEDLCRRVLAGAHRLG